MYGLKPTRFDEVHGSLQSLLGGCSDYVLKYEKGFAWSLCCDMLLDTCTCCQSCSWTLSLVGAATSVIFVVTKALSWQNFCCDKLTFAATNTCLLWQNTRLLSWQKYACHDRTVRDKHMFVMTKVLWQQKWYLWQLLPMIEHRLLSTILATLAARSAFTCIHYNLHA